MNVSTDITWHTACGNTALGWLSLVWHQSEQHQPALCIAGLAGQQDDARRYAAGRLRQRLQSVSPVHDEPAAHALWQAVASLTEAPQLTTDFLQQQQVRLDLHGSAFQQLVWQHIAAIPPAATLTYRQLAQAAGRERAVRAAASACGANPLALVIPCHRVLRSDGGLGGYRWGMARKQALLTLEAAQPSC